MLQTIRDQWTEILTSRLLNADICNWNKSYTTSNIYQVTLFGYSSLTLSLPLSLSLSLSLSLTRAHTLTHAQTHQMNPSSIALRTSRPHPVSIQLMYEIPCRSANTGVSISRIPQKNVAYDIILTSPVVPYMSFSFYLDELWDGGSGAVQLTFFWVLIPWFD